MRASLTIETGSGHTVYVLTDRKTGSTARILADYGFNCFSFQAPLA